MAADDSYYRILQVDPSATALELKRAYRRQAVLHHPDKNPDELDAAETFKAIAEAYQVLSDPVLRRTYDERGKSGIKDCDSFVNPVALFSRIFGGESFKTWVGDLALMRDIVQQVEMEAQHKNHKDEALVRLKNFTPRTESLIEDAHHAGSSSRQRISSELFSEWKLKEEKRIKSEAAKTTSAATADLEKTKRIEKEERVNFLADKLTQRLAKLSPSSTSNEINAFFRYIEEEREQLKLESFGIAIIQCIAKMYRARAQAFMDSRRWFVLGSVYHQAADLWGGLRDGIGALRAAQEATSAMNLIPSSNSGDNEPPNEPQAPVTQELESLAAGKVIFMSWETTRLELRSILKAVVDRVLYEPGISDDEQCFRAELIMRIANIFDQVKKDLGDVIDETFELLVAKAARVTTAELQQRKQRMASNSSRSETIA